MANQRLNFADLLSQRTACAQEDLAIIGGTVQETDVRGWLAEWHLQSLPWQIWEEVSALRLEKDTPLPLDFALVERGQIFGEGGNLTLRRDGTIFRWHFIGLETTGVQVTPDVRNFWQEHPGAVLQRVDQKAILWGAWRPDLGRWHDNRVGWANLQYPAELNGKHHVYVHYDEYLESGRVAFVWLRDLKGDRS